ncbi:RNA polymerase sigma factor [Sphingobacterium faecale]|uniref:Sigma-70 family RNA polymerase sigma factor n=1 Tax=Sphingobacterium faecale TaxID=2803775 RepID=A0ABS1R5R6_9SPHI|nr:sigma-70 family RNA polymerase sigma factor [Sphingobacterium faecale]MBL1410042.1 sigma-70 family RNA polymerase sigma factor [Sphingobacterium faecale]
MNGQTSSVMQNASNDSLSERELVVLLQQGDYTAFEILYDRHYTNLTHIFFRLLKSPELVEELLQELFLKLWQYRGQIDADRPLRPWLNKIAENLVLEMYRKAARDERLKNSILQASKYIYTNLEEDLLREENIKLVREAISLLPPQRQRIFTLCKLDGLSYNEVAAQLGISTSAVNKHITEANKFLRQYFSSQEGLILLITASISFYLK